MTDLEKLSAWATKRSADFLPEIEVAERRNDPEAHGWAVGRVSAYQEMALLAAHLAKGNDLTGIKATV